MLTKRLILSVTCFTEKRFPVDGSLGDNGEPAFELVDRGGLGRRVTGMVLRSTDQLAFALACLLFASLSSAKCLWDAWGSLRWISQGNWS